MSKQNRTSNLSFLMLGLVILLCLSWVWQLNSQSERMEFSQVEQLFRQEKVESFVIRDNTLLMTLRGEPEGRNTLRYELYDFDLFYDSLGELVEKQAAKGIITSYDYQQDHSTNWLEILLPFLLTAALIGGMGYLFLLRAGLSSSVTMVMDAAPLVRKYCFKKARVLPESRMSSTMIRCRPVMSWRRSWSICTRPEEAVAFP